MHWRRRSRSEPSPLRVAVLALLTFPLRVAVLAWLALVLWRKTRDRNDVKT